MRTAARALPWLVAMALSLALERGAAGALFIDRLPELDSCAEAATFLDTDVSPMAMRARRRCRLEMFQRTLAYEEHRAAPFQQRAQDMAVAAWVEKQQIPARVMRPNAVDGFLSSGLVVYGLTLAGVLWPSVEVEGWIGWRSPDHFLGNYSIQENRRCMGGRGKWLMSSRGNVSPFLSGGAAYCSISLTAYNFSVSTPSPDGEGVAHVLTGSGGVTWTTSVGFRISLEYIYAGAFYVQASNNQPNHPHDMDKRNALIGALGEDRHGLRLQVGYAF